MTVTDYFLKIPHTMLRIPEFIQLIGGRNSTVFGTWSTICTWAYYNKAPAFGNKWHTESAFLAQQAVDGHLASTITPKEIARVTGYDKRSVESSIEILSSLKLLRRGPIYKKTPIFYVGHAVPGEKVGSTEYPTYLDIMGRRASSPAGSHAVQALSLIHI